MKKENQQQSPLRVALYVRVSGQGAGNQGLSLEAQQEDLEEYARERGWVIVGVYIDAAKTARKRLGKRTNFLRMLEDVKRDKVDLILFTRLDRWFRSVADYYKVIEVLEAHHCGWLTTQEQYDTTTAGGRLYINLRLSIAQNEADLCGERIGAVFDSKIKHGTVISGSCLFGYRVNEEKKMEVAPENAAIVLDAFEHYRTTVSQRATLKYIRETYGITWIDAMFRKMLQNKLYIGQYESRGRINKDFCPAIVPQALFYEVQELMAGNVKIGPSGRVYLFSSLLICDECGHRLSSLYNKFVYYRCNYFVNYGRCTHDKSVRESYIEEWLFAHLADEIEKCQVAWDIKESQRRRAAASVDRASIRRKLSRLKELYVNEVIDLDEYRRDYEKYTSQLNEPTDAVDERRPNFDAIKAVLSKNFRDSYNRLDRAEKRSLWHSIIKEIRIDKERQITSIVFL